MDETQIHVAKRGYLQFIETCQQGAANFSLTPRAEPSAYARCFAVFGLHLLRQQDRLDTLRPQLVVSLRKEIRSLRKHFDGIPVDKSYRQLLTFTLSALAVLDALDDDSLDELVIEQLPEDIEQALMAVGALNGQTQSGNQAMFLAIFLLHARDRMGLAVKTGLMRWVELHVAGMNRFGFWGSDAGMRHLLFQNGYHQYEILEYMGVETSRISSDAVAAVRSLSDSLGHFAPYPGGGGCYDYDAVFILTPNGKIPDPLTEALLRRTASVLLSEQTSEGGWSESRYVRPRSAMQLTRFASHVVSALPNLILLQERLRYALALQRSRYNRIQTHWSHYSRRWDEADLWDSWFRLLAVARIQVACEPDRAGEWGFIDYPGIGYHPALAMVRN